LVAAIGFILFASTTASAPRYLGVFLAVQCIFCLSLLLAWVANMHATESKRAGGCIVLGRSSDNAVWYLGVSNNLSKPREDFTKNHDRTDLFPADEKPYYRKCMWISCALWLVVTVCSIALSLLLIRENKNMEAAGEFTHEEELGEIRVAPHFDSSGCARTCLYLLSACLQW